MGRKLDKLAEKKYILQYYTPIGITMKILNFNAKSIHGCLNFNLKFNPRLTFLTGINGSGKTTVVRSLSSLISPSIINLAYLDYKHIEVIIKHEKQDIKIWTTKTFDNFTLNCSIVDESLDIPVYPYDEEIYISPNREDKKLAFYREKETEISNHPVIKSIRSLPSPMLLGIERRSIDPFSPEDRASYVPLRYSLRTRRSRNIFGNTLYEGLSEAERLAVNRYRRFSFEDKKFTENLRNKILLTSLKYEEVILAESPSFQETSDKITSSEEQVISILNQLGLPKKEVRLNVSSYINSIKKLSPLLKDEKDIYKTLSSDNSDKKNAATQWILNYPTFNRIIEISNYIAEYISNREKREEQIKRYLNILNNFLKDSGKKIAFTEEGNLQLKMNGNKTMSITDLSSGESQLIVIITHIMFNPAAKRENVFIVDEPELSLHLLWQEFFVDAIKAANPRLQLIFATHSLQLFLIK